MAEGSSAASRPGGRDDNLPRYLRSRRRVLIDMQIPDWDDKFLSGFDAADSVRRIRATGADAVMLYFQSHVGLCNWPSASGRMHAAFRGRDIMTELLSASLLEGLAVCGYYSVNFNNSAWIEQEEWRLQPAKPAMIGAGLLQAERYGICCLNNAGYREFVRAQVTEILSGYALEAILFDMVWWMSVCTCTSCRDRFRLEEGHEIPQEINWRSEHWCKFQAARERWLIELATELRDLAHRLQPKILVYHNFAVALGNWTRGVTFESAMAHDFLGGDFYGGRDEQMLVSSLMQNLSPQHPIEFMTTITANLAEHERLKSVDQLREQALTAALSGAAFLGIASIDPRGGHNQAALELLREVYEEFGSVADCTGGSPVEQIAVYFSSASKMSFADDGLALKQAPADRPMDYPHLRAVKGACRLLHRAHLPFGVITRRQLLELENYQVIILPNLLRMDDEEVAAFRAYVHRGGRIYASRYTSLTSTDGRRHTDFMLEDVFGCHAADIETGRNLYLQPVAADCAEAIAPERALSHWLDPQELTGAIRLADQPAGRTLMSLTLPYGYPSTGSVTGRDWASIHSFPPWQRTDVPTVVENEFGEGKSIYSAADVESGETTSHDRLFLHLVSKLMAEELAWSCEAHPSVSMKVFDQREASRWIVSFLHCPRDPPAYPPPAFRFQLSRQDGHEFTRLLRMPSGEDWDFTAPRPGQLVAQVDSLSPFALFVVEYS